MAESTGLLNLRGGNLSEGSNPSLSAIDCNQKQDVTQERASCFFCCWIRAGFPFAGIRYSSRTQEVYHGDEITNLFHSPGRRDTIVPLRVQTRRNSGGNAGKNVMVSETAETDS